MNLELVQSSFSINRTSLIKKPIFLASCTRSLNNFFNGSKWLTSIANEYDATCTISTNANLQLKRFGELLGFDNNTTINSRSSKSSKTININSNLRYIQINCDAVDRTCNIDNDGKRSATLLTLPITTKDSLKGSVSHYTDIESKIPINKGVYNKLFFDVITNNKKTHFGSILMELYIM